MDTEVLVVGAGPTGLVLALWLARLGIQVRIIDKTAGPGSTSRALAVQARTLEFYRQLGFADELVEAGLVFSAANLWARGRRAAHVELGRLGAGKSPFPYGLIYPQDEHERFLIERLKELDVRVERMTELIDFEEVDGRIVARLQGSTCETECLAGCDGARSTVREKLGISFPGGTYEHLFYVADVDASGPLMDRELHVSIDESDFAAVFPLKGEGRVRLIGTIRPGAEKEGEHLGWEDVGKNVLQRLRIDVRRLIGTTDRVFQFITRSGRLAARVRVHVAPRVISALFRLPSVRRFMFRTVSQTAIEYRGSDLSEGRAGGIRGGDRLPWLRSEPDNFTPLQSLDWQMQVHGAATRELAASCASRGLRLHVFPWSRSAAGAGVALDASYLVRPDGHVALADPLQSPARLERYLDARGIRFIAAPGRTSEALHPRM